MYVGTRGEDGVRESGDTTTGCPKNYLENLQTNVGGLLFLLFSARCSTRLSPTLADARELYHKGVAGGIAGEEQRGGVQIAAVQEELFGIDNLLADELDSCMVKQLVRRFDVGRDLGRRPIFTAQ